VRTILIALLLVLLERHANAQACCAGANALTPARLPEDEWLLFGTQSFVRPNMGRWNEHGDYVQKPLGTNEIDAELDLYASWRTPWKRLQVSALFPFVLTGRAAQGTSAVGVGVGDLNLGLRLDVLEKGQIKWFPLGVAVLAGITLPTGKPATSATQALAVDASGEGTVDGIAGLSLEHAIGPWLFDAIALATLHAPRNISEGVEQTRGPGLLSLGAVTYVFTGGDAVGAMLTYRVEWDANIAGQSVKDSSRRLFRFGLFGLHPITMRWRLSGSVTIDPPISELGQNELAGVTLLLGLQRGFD
jgi:hypothetical protein